MHSQSHAHKNWKKIWKFHRIYPNFGIAFISASAVQLSTKKKATSEKTCTLWQKQHTMV